MLNEIILDQLIILLMKLMY